jgi:hypothetical protein
MMKNQGQTLSCIMRFKLQKNKKRGGEHLCWLFPVNRGEEVPGEGEGEACVPLLHPALQPQHHWEPTATRITKCFPLIFFKATYQQCCGSGMFIPDPGSDFFPSRIPDPNFSIPDPGSASKNLSILTQKIGF